MTDSVAIGPYAVEVRAHLLESEGVPHSIADLATMNLAGHRLAVAAVGQVLRDQCGPDYLFELLQAVAEAGESDMVRAFMRVVQADIGRAHA